MIQGRGFLWSIWLKEARATSMFLKEEEASSFLCLYLLLLLLLLLDEEMELEWLLDNSDGRIIPIIFIWHRWVWDPIKKASEPRSLTAATAIIIGLPLCFSFSLWSRFLSTKTTETLLTNLEDWRKGFGEAAASPSKTTWAWTVGTWDHAWSASKTLAFWRRRDSKFTANTIQSRFAFKF